MKITRILAVSMASIVLLASCVKGENGQNNNGGDADKTGRAVMLDIKRGEESLPNNIGSRAEGPNIGNSGVEVTIDNGMLFFVNDAGSIFKALKVVKSGETTDSQINIYATGAQTIHNVPVEATKVCIVCNVDFPENPGVMSEVIKYASLASQYDGAGGVSKTNVYGESAMVQSDDDEDVYEAKIVLNSLTGRIEIDKFTATGQVSEYQIDGIFINNYYYQVMYDGTVVPADFVEHAPELNGQDPKVYIGGSDEYPLKDNNTYFDYDEDGIGSCAAGVYTPKTGATWSYNVYAINGEMPRVIIRMSNFVGSEAPQGFRYLTIKGFTDVNDPTGTPLEFEAGKIYRIKNFEFDSGDLAAIPEVDFITAAVSVEIAKWEEIEVKPIN